MVSSAWALRSSVTMLIGFNPAFSASVYGTTSSASANARMLSSGERERGREAEVRE